MSFLITLQCQRGPPTGISLPPDRCFILLTQQEHLPHLSDLGLRAAELRQPSEDLTLKLSAVVSLLTCESKLPAQTFLCAMKTEIRNEPPAPHVYQGNLSSVFEKLLIGFNYKLKETIGISRNSMDDLSLDQNYFQFYSFFVRFDEKYMLRLLITGETCHYWQISKALGKVRISSL